MGGFIKILSTLIISKELSRMVLKTQGPSIMKATATGNKLRLP